MGCKIEHLCYNLHTRDSPAPLPKGNPMTEEKEPSNDLRIYVACLAAYNAGKLHGKWLDVSDYHDADDLSEAVQQILKESPEPDAEEYAIHDTENCHGLIGEHSSLQECIDWQELIDEHGETAHAAAMISSDVAEVGKYLEAGCHCGEDRREMAEDYAEDCGYLNDLPNLVRNNINWDGLADDLFEGMPEVRFGGNVYIFYPY